MQRHRRIVHDNIATPGAPVWRARYATPLTPRAVRLELVRQAMEVSEAERPSWIEARLTPLDRALTDEEANALEQFVNCEQWLAGNPRGSDYAGDRVQSSRVDMQHLPDEWREEISNHVVRKHRLPGRDLQVLTTFVQQMTSDNAPSDAEAAISLGLQGSDRRAAWVECVAGAARRLV